MNKKKWYFANFDCATIVPVFLRNREHTQYAQVMGLLLSCLPRRQENRNDREWAGCPSQPAEPRCERSFRVVMLSCRPQASVAPFSRVLPLELLWRRGALPPHFSCHYQLSCSLLLLSPWLMPAVASKMLSWSSLHHCSSKQCLSVGGNSMLPDIFPAEVAEGASFSDPGAPERTVREGVTTCLCLSQESCHNRFYWHLIWSWNFRKCTSKIPS